MKTYQIICFVLIGICIGIACYYYGYHFGFVEGIDRTEVFQAQRIIKAYKKGVKDGHSYVKSIEDLQKQYEAPDANE